MSATTCYLCGSDRTREFFCLPEMPTQDGIMCDSFEAAQSVVRGDIRLRYCSDCGYIGNEGHEADKIAFGRYDFSLDHSPLFQSFNRDLCAELVDRYQLNGSTVIDVGCGEGRFLTQLCRQGGCRGYGIDPGFDNDAARVDSDLELVFLREYYGPPHRALAPDLLSCRQVINLLNDPFAFLESVRDNLDPYPGTVVYFEVPDANYTLNANVVWNLVYEHRSWFSADSLAELVRRAGFDVLRVDSRWNGEYLSIEARPSLSSSQNPVSGVDDRARDTIARSVDMLEANFAATKQRAEAMIEKIRAQSIRAVAWGAGARAMTFFNLFDLYDACPVIVDINQRRQGKYLPGSGQRIVSPDSLVALAPDLLIITNPTYAAEIKEHVAQMGLTPEFWIL